MDYQLLEDILHEDDRFAIMIDGPNLYQSTRVLSLDIDYRILLETFAQCARLMRASYYTALLDDTEYSPIRPLVDWLCYNGYNVVTKPLKEFTDPAGRKRFKGNMHIELAVDAMELSQHLDHIVLFSGDGGFCRLTDALQRKGLQVTVVSTLRTQPSMISSELRRQANTFLELQDLGPLIARVPRQRAAQARGDTKVDLQENTAPTSP